MKSEEVLELLKEAKNILVRKQAYEQASILRDLERILIYDGDKLDEYSLKSIFNIIKTIINSMNTMETSTQNKTINYTEVKKHISEWLKNYANNAGQNGYIIGVSGGIDSSVCSTLCALTGLQLTVVKMSIHQAKNEESRGIQHINE